MGAPVTLPVEIDGQTWRLTFKFGTIRNFERELGKPLADAFPSAGSGASISLDVLSALFWAVLQPSHRITREGSDDLIDVAGIEAVGGWITQGIGAYFSNAPTADAEGNGANPGKPGKGKKGAPLTS